MTGPRTVLLAAALALAGCASSPPSTFYTLSAVASPAPAGASTYGVSVGPVNVPETVDRPQLMLQVSANRVALEEFHRWAEPLAGGIAQTVAANLRSLLGTARVAAAPGFSGGKPVYRVSLDVVRFESRLGESATLDVLWTVGRDDDIVRSGLSEVVQPAPGGYDALVAAHSQALARVSADIAAAIRSLAGG